QVERVDRLNVVVVVQQQRVLAPPTLLAVDSRGTVGGTEVARLKASAMQEFLDQLGSLIELTCLRGHTRLSAEQLQDPNRVFLDPRIVPDHDPDPTLRRHSRRHGAGRPRQASTRDTGPRESYWQSFGVLLDRLAAACMSV